MAEPCWGRESLWHAPHAHECRCNKKDTALTAGHEAEQKGDRWSRFDPFRPVRKKVVVWLEKSGSGVKDLEAAGGSPMTTFLGMKVEQSDDGISLQLDTYAQELIEEYRLIRKKFIKPRTVPMSPGLVLDNSDCPELPDPVKQKLFLSMLAKVQFAAYWIRFDISYPTAQLAQVVAAGPRICPMSIQLRN